MVDAGPALVAWFAVHGILFAVVIGRRAFRAVAGV